MQLDKHDSGELTCISRLAPQAGSGIAVDLSGGSASAHGDAQVGNRYGVWSWAWCIASCLGVGGMESSISRH
jgi:hypothetical protein